MTLDPTRDHCRWDPKSNLLTCEHCGGWQEIPMPSLASVVIAIMDIFLKAHKRCKTSKPNKKEQ